MEKRLLLFISILLTSIGFVFGQNALTDILPKYSKTINGNCFLVGNTNTQLVDLIGKTTDDVTQEIEYEGELGAIKNTPVNTDNISIKNCNFAEFCLTIQTECGETSVEDARISWGGREETPLSSTSTVYVKITDNTGKDLPIAASLAEFQAISGSVIKKTPTKSVQNDGFYVVHQEITDYINAVLKDPGFPKTGTYRIYVANVPVKLKRTDPSEDAGQFCGWNFSLVYRHPLLPRRSIMVYNTDLFQESTSSGNTPDPIFSSFKFGNANPFKTNDTISFVFCNFGGMLLQTTDCFRLNKEGDLLSIMPNDKKYYGKGGKLQFQDQAITNNGSTVDDNPFRCMINYLYENKDCSIKQYNPYSRGFDLTKTTLAPVSQNTYNYIQQNDSAFNLTIVPTQEYHLFTNALLYIGAPDAPEAALPMEVSKTDIMPDDTFKCVLYVKTGENKNGLTNINVRIPISEYIASIDSFNIEFHSLVKSTNNGTNSANSYPTISTVKDAIVSDKPSTTKVRDWNQTNNNKFMKEALTFVNDYLEEVDKINDNYATTKPSVLKTREIIFSFPNLIVPNKVTDEDAITITLILHSKSEDDPIYNKQTYMGGTPQVIPQAQLDLTDNVTRDTSIFESSYEKDIDWEKYKCEINGDGGDGSSSDDGGSDCTGLNGGTKTGSGIYKKNNTNLVEVNILANGDCRETPDSINIHFCDELYIAAIDIKRQLAKMDFDIDSIAKVDSCLWESHKRDSLVGFAGKHGVNRALLEELLSNNDNPIELIDTTKAWDNFFNGCQPKLDADDVESIVNMETEFSDIYVLFNEDTQDTIPANVFQKSNFISLRDENSLSEVFHITDSEKLFIYYKSPWNNKGASCDKYIPIYFIKKEMKDPIIICNNDTIHKNDTIYACLGNELQNIKIHKNFPEYNVYAAIKDTIGGSEQIVFDNIINNTFDTIATWEIKKTGGIDTNIPGTRRISIWEKDLAESCKGDSFSFFIKVLDLKIDETPDLSGNTETEFCRSINPEDSITLRVTKDASHQEYKVLWYRVDKDVDEILRIKIGEGDTVNIPMDTAFTDSYITLRYEATYFKDHCESNPESIDIKFNNFADSITTDTMVICQYYRLNQDDVFTQLNDWNPGKSYSANNVKFYPYYDVALGDIEENMKQALKKDSMSFEHLMDNLDTQTGCATDGTRHTHFIVQGVTDKGCGGVPSLVTVKINCRTKDAPVFGGGVDSIRYCTGDSPITDFDEFLDEPGDYSGGYKWVWESLADAASLPVDKYRSTAYGNVTTGGNPMTNTAVAGEESYVVVRIDSNSCVSDVDTFRIVVADAITSYAMIGDTTKVINVTEKEFSLNFCEGANPYSSKTLPAVGYPSRDYILEWYKKDNQNDDCDTLEKYNKNRLEYTIDIDYSNTDTIFYAMRQSTDQGCKGPWLNVGIYIHPNVDSVPLIDTVEMCEGEFPKGFNIHKTTDTDLMLYLYASDKTTEVLESEMKVDTTADRYLFSAGKSLYYAQYKNKNTQCYGPLVGANAIVNPKPHLPQMNEDTTVYLCAVDDTVNLTAKIEATINNLDLNTRIGWTPKDHVITKEESNAKYYVFQEDSITKCVGESIEINVKVENTIKYHPFGIKNLCYGESISLQDTINKLLSSKNDIILQKDQKVNIYQLINNVKGSKVTQSILSQKTKDQNDTTKYLIEIEDIISGCRVTDTATVIFNGLPNASVDNQISACQDVVFTLPTPKDNTYNYIWKRETGDKVNGNPAQLVLHANETVRLVEVNPSTGCVDSFDVDITIYPTPAHALTRDTAFCQNTTNKKIDVTIQTTADGFNDDKNDFNLQWFNAQMDSVSNPIITDDLTLNGISNAFQYTVRQRNTITQCYKDTTITVKIRKTPELGELTIDPVCEPATISLYQEAIDHVSKNIVKNNFENTSSLRFSFGQIINLQSHPLTEAEAQEIHYTAGSDSVIYTYTVEDDVCSASDTLYITINKKPNTPIIEEGKDTVWFCKDDAPIYLSARNTNDAADTQNPTQIHWGNYTTSTTGDSILITKSASDYYAFSQNERTGCVSDLDTIHAVISFPVEFAKTGTLHFCFRDSFDLYQEVEKKVLLNTKNSKSDLRFNIYKMSGNVPDFNNPIRGKVASNKSIHETDTTNYFIEIIDHVSGCQFLDTATMIFHGLPVIESIPDIEICQYQDTALPTPNKGYDYSWYRSADNRLINDPTHYNTGEKEHIYLKAIEQFPLNNLTCYDSLMVYMDVKKIPVAATVQSDTFCQLSGEHLIPVTLNESDDNPKKDLSILWFNEKGDTVSTPINTDEVVMTGNSTTIKYTIRQRNVTNGCFHDTIVPFVVNRAIKLQMEDLPAVCQPESIDFRTNVLNYLTSSTTTNISNVSNYDITYSKIVNKQESALTDEEASNIQYTAGVDSMLYAYNITDGICSASDSVYITINKKPSTPIIEEGKDTVWFCKDDAPIYLSARNTNDAADTQNPTQIHWGNYTTSTTGDSILITKSASDYYAFSQNERTGCVSDLDTIHAVISFPVEFAKTGTLHFCFRDSFDLYQDVEKKVLLNTKNTKSDLRFNIFKMSGNVPDFNNPIKGKVASNKSIHETDTTNYFIEIIDHVSGCQFLDTATMIFHGLPVIESIPDIEICQYQDTALPTPNKGYDYSWYRSADNRLINDPTHYNTGEKEHIYLKAVEQFPLNNLTCYDSLMVYMDVKKIPVAATVQSDTFCQLSGEHLIPVTLNESDDNQKKDLSILWFNEKGDTVSTPINTDEVVMTGNSTTIKYTIRQRNVTNGCFHDTIVPFVVNRAIKLQMEDLPAVCQPDSIDFRTNVLNYLTSSTTTNISNVSNYDITYSKIVNKQESALTDEEASNIQYTAGVDSMLYTYNITDGICSASDSVYVTINKKPSTPIIEEGKDTVWFCSANGQLHLTAKQDNDTQKTKIFWGDYTSTQQGDTFLIPSTPPVAQYTAFAKNIQSGCVSGFDTIIAEIKEAIKVNPIADNGKMEKCEGETVNVYDLAMASFVIDSTPHTKIRFIATENGFSIGENELKNVSKTQQDTLHYIFTVEDEMTQCDATNELTLIFHKNPTFKITGKTTLCEGDTVELSAVGDERAVTYAWRFEESNVMSTSADFSIINIRQDTTIYLIESLKGTTCSDTLTQHLTVNVAPAPLPDTAFSLCQDTAAKENRTVNIGRSNSNIQGYSIRWYNQNSEMISEKEFVEVSTTQTASYSYQIETIDKKTNCVSQRNHVVITVNPQITIGLDKVDTICQPFTYALKTNAISSVSGGTNPIYDRTESNGTLVANDDSISESGLYTLYFTDDNQCEASKTLSIQFYEQPGTPQLIGDTILCQGTGIAQFTAKKIGANSMNQTFEWKSQAEETLADTLNFNTQNYGITPYTLQAVDQKSNCRSEALSFTVDVRESIQYSPIELLEGCFGTTIDLAEKAEKSYSGNDEEKKLSYYYLSENQNLTSVTAPEAISKSGQYVIKANEEISGCERQDTVEIIIYDSIGVSTEGSKEICQGEEVEGLIAINADRYTWIRGNGNSEETASFPFASSVTESEKFRLIGEKKIGSLFCQDSLDIQITVHTNPATLPDTTLYFCQDTTGGDKEIILEKIIGDGEKLALTWTDEAGDTLFIGEEEATTSIKEYGTVVYHVTQVNTDTKCSSKQADVTITTLPQIRVRLKDTTTCVPNNINLVNLAGKAAHAEGFDDDITVSAYEIMNNGRATDVTGIADSITSGGTYRITYQYESNGAICQSEGISQLTFNTQPSKPSVADQNFCQNTGEYELKGKVNANNVRLLWEDLSVYPPKADTNTTTISTDIATRKLYLVRQVQDLSGCVSEADSSWMTVYPAIESMDKDTAICYGETVNLYDFTNGSYIGGTPKHSVTFKNAEGITFDAEKVNKSGTYFAYYSDSMNICHDTASLVINIDDPMEITVAGGGAACTDQTIVLEATGAENYEWSNGKKEPSITVISEEAQTMTFSVEGRRIFKDIYCKADTNVTIVFNNAVKPRELTFDTCARNIVTIDDIILKNNVTETVDTIWNKTDDVRFANIFQNLGKTGTYELAVHNEEGCTAHHILNVKMHSVENLKVNHQEGTYCYGSLANFKVSGENAREFEWTNLTDGTITTGEIYNEAITETTDFRLIATEKELGCKDTVDFTIEAYPNKEITITGNVTSCRDSLIVLSAESVLTDVRWDFEDSIVSGRDIRFIADNDRKIILKGTDENGCPAEKPVNISVAYLEDPIIEFDLIEDSEYALSDDVKEIELREKYTPSGSNLYKFTWNFGDGKMEVDSSSNSIFHTYNDTIIHSRRDINVNLLVEHQYGCKKSASAILKIDPFIFVPNTMIADGEYIFMEDYDLQIFDRVGTLIYQGKGWDGSYKGEPASEDTYFYSLTYFEKGEKKFKTGYITLVR